MTSQRYHPYTRPSAPATSSVSILSNAQGVAFNGNPTFHVNDSTSASTEESLEDKGMKILREKVATGAMHNSGERFDPPKCHPGTRVALQDNVCRWVDGPPGGQFVTWLFGAAGAGKSAIAQTISQKLHAEGKLTASFFFSRRESASKGRGDESSLIPTLALQLSLSAPQTKPLIARAMRENPVLFDLSLDDQVQLLIVHPLSVILQENPEYDCPTGRVIVVDGLDECRKEDNAQSRIISALINGLSTIPQRSQKLFITSRPEHNIVAAFRGFKSELVRKIELNSDWKPDNDIWTFLEAGFAEIRSSHSYFEDHPVDEMWPSRADMCKLVSKSSGQFIYAAVVLKYIKSDDYYDPAARLEVILQLKNNGDRPYAELDALYQYIFSQIRGVEKVLTVLSLERMFERSVFAHSPNRDLFLSHLTGARIEEIKFWLRPLVSLLTWQNLYGRTQIVYLHASLPDFLADESRSDMFCISSLPIATSVVRRALDLLQEKDTFEKNINLIPVLLTIPRHYSGILSLRIQIPSLLIDFNFVDSVLSQICLGSLSGPSFNSLMELALQPLGLYLEWILAESESNPVQVLVNSLSQISTWISKQLVSMTFDLMDGTGQVDMWPFFMASAKKRMGSPSVKGGLKERIRQDTAAALKIYGLPNSTYRVAKYQYIEVSNQAAFFYHLTPHIPRWLDNTTLLGRHAITGERYRAVFLRTWNYMLPQQHCPKNMPYYDWCDIFRTESDSTSLARITFCENMDCLPLSMELYFLVLYMGSVAVNHYHYGAYPFEVDGIRRSVKRYLLLMRTKFPFLSNPACPEYMKAQADAEATWIETKKGLYNPVPSIRVEQLPDLDLGL